MNSDHRYRQAVQFRVLGPLEVDLGEGPVPLGGPKQRAVLGNLLVRANQIVPVDALIDEVWGDEPPEQARNTLQTYVSNLRRAIGDDRVVGRSPGYVLVVGPTELDAARFDTLVRSAKVTIKVDPSTSVATIEDALALWRGPALADLSERPGLIAEAARLEELRLEAQSLRLEALVAIGENVRAIAELDALLAREPLRESLWALRMLALYREGRQAEALEDFRRARDILNQQLGIDPSRELATLHERVLRHDPGLDLAGEPLRGYRLMEKIGEGNDATVFRALQPHVGRDVAIKVFTDAVASDRGFVRRFDEDAQRVAAIEHPGVATTYDAWREPRRAYVVSRFLRGGSLQELLDRGERPGPAGAVRILDTVASALAAAHGQGVPHGHLCASNILFDAEGTPYLSDFLLRHGPPGDKESDVKALASLARELLPDHPGEILQLAQRVEAGESGVTALSFARAARSGLDPESARRSAAQDSRNPYKGLRAFAETDAADFFGRTALVRQLVAELDRPGWGARFLAVVGPSGCGKSSVVRAGLIPALRHGLAGGATERYVAELVPGERPLEELEAALRRVAARDHPRTLPETTLGSRRLLTAVEHALPDGAELVLVVDQLEELYTLTSDVTEREEFLDLLRVACVDPDSRLRVLVTLRADFYDRPLASPRFGELLAARTVAVPPLAPDEVEQAIRRPSEQVGVKPDRELEALMIADLADQPGALPLLQFALTQLFEAREDHRLTVTTYDSIGGIGGALSKVAERLAQESEPGWTETVRQVFLRLVTLGEGSPDTRRRVPRRDLDALDVDAALARRVVEAYGHQRLLTFDREPVTREPTVEIAHEVLLREWSRLARWIDESREDLRRERALNRAASEWRAAGKDDSFLLGGARLEQEAAWLSQSTVTVDLEQRAFVKASLDRRDERRRREQSRAVREARTERRSKARLRALVAVFAVAALVAAALTLVATEQKERADVEARAASARALAAAAVANLSLDPERSILLALAAVDTTRSTGGTVLVEAEDALHRAVASSRTVLSVDGIGGEVAWSSLGDFAAVSPQAPGTVVIGEAATGVARLTLALHDDRVSGLAFDPTGRLLASTSDDGRLQLVDTRSGRHVLEVRGSGPATGPTFDRTGRLVAAAWPEERTARVVRTGSDQRQTSIGLPVGSDVVALRPDGRALGVASGTGDLVVVGLPDQRELSRTRVSELGSFVLSWSPDGRLAAIGTIGGAEVWEVSSGERVATLPGHPWIGLLAWGPDSHTLVTGGDQAPGIKVWEVAAGSVGAVVTLSSTGTSQGVGGLTMSPDGSRVMAGSEDGGRLWVWDVTRASTAEHGAVETVTGFGDVAFLPGGRLLAADPHGRFRIHDLADGRASAPIGPDVVLPWGEHQFTLSPDGTLLALPGQVSAWDTRSGVQVFTSTSRADLDGVAWNADGSLLAVADHERHVTAILDRAGTEVAILPDQAPGVTQQARFSPDGSLLVTIGEAASDGTSLLTVWDLPARRVLRTMTTEGATGLAFDASGTRVVTQLGPAAVWDVRTGERIGTLDPAATFVTSSPDGRFVAIGGVDGTIQLFDGRALVPLYVLQTNEPLPVGRLTFSADGSRLAAQSLGGQDQPGIVRVWALDLDELVQIARSRLTRGLTAEECHRYLPGSDCPEQTPTGQD